MGIKEEEEDLVEKEREREKRETQQKSFYIRVCVVLFAKNARNFTRIVTYIILYDTRDQVPNRCSVYFGMSAVISLKI